VKYLIPFLLSFLFNPISYADEIDEEDQLPIYVGIKLGSGSANASERLPFADLVSTNIEESLSSKGVFFGLRLFETSSKSFFVATELSSTDHGKVAINATTTTTNYFASQTIKSTDFELIFGIKIRKKLAFRIGLGTYLPKINLTSDMPHLDLNDPGWVVTDPNVSGNLRSIGFEAHASDQVLLVVDYAKYSDIAYDFTGLYKKGLDVSVFNIKIAYIF
jgi:hypothetical protein